MKNTQTNCISLGCGPNKTSEHVVSAFGNAGFTQFSGIFWLKNSSINQENRRSKSSLVAVLKTHMESTEMSTI